MGPRLAQHIHELQCGPLLGAQCRRAKPFLQLVTWLDGFLSNLLHVMKISPGFLTRNPISGEPSLLASRQ